MTRAVLWSRDALDDLKKQLVYLAVDDPVAAHQIVDRLRKAAALLEDFATGRPGRVVGTYEKSLNGLPYIIAYEIVPRDVGEVVAIVRVIHTARDWPKESRPSD
jgi:plasmid stabilization system protein ParE